MDVIRIFGKTCSLFQTVAELGVVIFTALDFGLKEDEERQLSPALENVIDLMTSAGEKIMAGLKKADKVRANLHTRWLESS